MDGLSHMEQQFIGHKQVWVGDKTPNYVKKYSRLPQQHVRFDNTESFTSYGGGDSYGMPSIYLHSIPHNQFHLRVTVHIAKCGMNVRTYLLSKMVTGYLMDQGQYRDSNGFIKSFKICTMTNLTKSFIQAEWDSCCGKIVLIP